MGNKTQLAIAGRCGGWLVAQWSTGGWNVVSRELQDAHDPRQCYRPMAVFDLNGDGTPEIVLRFTEGEGEWWGEQVLQRDPSGSWRQVALSPGGSTA